MRRRFGQAVQRDQRRRDQEMQKARQVYSYETARRRRKQQRVMDDLLFNLGVVGAVVGTTVFIVLIVLMVIGRG